MKNIEKKMFYKIIYVVMPRLPMDYSKTHFHKIVCKDLVVKDCYVGSTTNFTIRKWTHKKDCANEHAKLHNIKLYKFIRGNGGWENWEMALINVENHQNGFEAKRREREYVEQLNATLNMVRPMRTKDEAIENKKLQHEKHREDMKEYLKEYHTTNRDIILERASKYYEDNKQDVLNKKKQRYYNNRGYYLQKMKEYRESKKG